MKAEPEPPKDTTEADIARDRRDLHRGVAVNALGYVFKLAHPLMLIFVVRHYGAEAFGVFTFAQAVLLFAIRVSLFGLDKGLLWWTPQQAPGRRLSGTMQVLTIATLSSVVLAVLMASLGAPLMAALGDTPEATWPLRLMAAGLVPMVITEVTVHSTMGLKNMAPKVFVKETVMPLSMAGVALLLIPLELGTTALALAFLFAYTASATAAFWWWKHLFKGEPRRVRGEGWLPPRRMVRYALPLWLSEMSNSFLQRMDTYAVAAAMDLRMVGIYAAVTQIGNAIKTIRHSFDPIVLVIAADIATDMSAPNARARLREGYSQAVFLVTATQLPVLVFIIAFAAWLMPLFGEGFEEGLNAVIILCGFWVLNSAVSLAGLVVSATGRSQLVLLNTTMTIFIQGALLSVLLPHFGLEGAALSVGLAYSAQSLIQLAQMRLITGSWNLTPRVLRPSLLGGLAIAAMLAVWGFAPGSDELGWRAAAFGAFALVYLPGLYALVRR